MKISKAERQVNLTMALLASKRYLTRAEIFENVNGYEGAAESMERMFERDKVDLRELGIDISVGSNDPFFEDELGYRIDPNTYRLQQSDLTPRDLRYISLARKIWNGLAMSEAANRALIKLESLGVVLEAGANLPVNIQTRVRLSDLETAWQAFSTRTSLRFEYLVGSLPTRTVDIYRIFTEGGEWYLNGFDHEREERRTFKFSRLINPSLLGTGESYEIPADRNQSLVNGFEHEDQVATITASVALRAGRIHELRELGQLTPMNADWDRLEIAEIAVDELRNLALRYCQDLVIIRPTELRAELLARIPEFTGGN
jgi:proteasome accessory factor B